MPLETASIIGNIKPVQIDNPLDVQSKVLSLSALRDAGAMNQMKIDQAREEQGAQRTLSDLYRGAIKPDGTVDRQAILSGAAQRGLGSRIPALQKGFAEADKATADVGHTQAQTESSRVTALKTKFDLTSSAISSLLSRPQVTQNDVIGTIASLVQSKVIDQLTGEQMVQQVNQQTNPANLRAWLIGKGMESMDASKRMELALPKTDVKDTGGGYATVQVDQLTGKVTAGPQVLGKTQTPDSIASNSLGRDRLAFDKEQAGFAGGAGGVISLPGFGKAPPGYMWDTSTKPPSLKAIKGGPAATGSKPSAEVQRQLGGVLSFDKDLSALQEALKDFDPRNPKDQADPVKRARIQSLSNQALLSAKEAAALGALSGPDMSLMLGILQDPTSWRGSVAGGKGIQAQIDEARKGNIRRVQSLSEQYGPGLTENLPAALQPVVAPSPTPPAAPNIDPNAIAAELARREAAKGAK